MNPVRQAIWNALETDSGLHALATGGIFWRIAPSGTTVPICIYQKMAGTRMYTFSGEPLHEEVYMIKGVGFADDAEDIDEYCQGLLNNLAIELDGRSLALAPIAEGDLSYGEDVEGEHYEHVGTLYRVVTERSS